MPELPDVELYVEAIAERTRSRVFERLDLGSPFVLRSVSPRPSELAGKIVLGVRRLGKRIVIELEGETSVVIHLMIAGRFKWFDRDKAPSLRQKNNMALLVFDSGKLLLTEAGSKKRASIHLTGWRFSMPPMRHFERFCCAGTTR